MFDRLGRATVLVEDYDEALDFYVDTLGFETVFDAEIGGGVRAVHVAVPGQADDVGLWLLEPTTDEGRERVGAQTGGEPLLVLYADDCRATYEDLSGRGVTFHGEPEARDGDVVVHFEDCYGNHLVLVELGDAD